MAQNTSSPAWRAWHRLRKNRPALLGMAWIAGVTLLAALGYLITPDDTPNCDRQMIRIQLKPPGYRTDVLRIDNGLAPGHRSFLARMVWGQPSRHQWLPYQDFSYANGRLSVIAANGDSLVIPLASKEQFQTTSLSFSLGTDSYGRDMLSRLIIGARVSLLVGFIAVSISLLVGLSLGAMAGYFGGRVDALVMFLVNTVWSIPTLLLVIAIVLAFGRGVGIIFLAVGLTMWVDVARIVRGQVLSVKQMQYVEAAQAFGFSHARILYRHILPNVLGPVMVVAAANFATAILLEAGLGYLGFGVQPPTPSWGAMLNENYGYAISGKPLLALAPALAVMLLVLSFNLLGNGLRDALDVKMKV